ncbi:MAG: hypothetical protein MJ244_06565 [Clostridia bacterium]|nr:hypothetical protein [Clostridia bacterium]
MIEYILALLLTSGVIFLAYKAGKRAGIKEEQLRVEKQKDREWEQFVNVVTSNNSIDDASIGMWFKERADKSKTNMHTEL